MRRGRFRFGQESAQDSRSLTLRKKAIFGIAREDGTRWGKPTRPDLQHRGVTANDIRAISALQNKFRVLLVPPLWLI
jgi:hypothetical protein